MSAQRQDAQSVLTVNLKDMVDIDALQKIQDRFSNVTKFGAVISDHQGNPITKYSMFSPICQAIRNHPKGMLRCQKSDELLGHNTESDGTVSVHYCHAGLIDLAAPIIVKDSYLGVALCGQVLCDTFDMEDAKRRFVRCVKELGLDEEYMMAQYDMIPRVSYEKLTDVADLLQVIASHVVELGINRINQALINEINMYIVEEQKEKAALEQSLKLSELKSLESTVNPHFLFNALNTIARLAMLEDAPQTEEVAYALAELLRHNLRRVGTCVPFREELDYCNKYVQIQKVRFSDRFTVQQNVSEEAGDILIPAMTLQPLVENSLIHGLKNTSSGGRIRIDARVVDNVFILQVTDNGGGIDPEQLALLQEMLKNKGITDGTDKWMGLSNVCRQFHYYFDSSCAMDITSIPGKETKVTITAYHPANIIGGQPHD